LAREPLDPRLPVLGGLAWLGALVGLHGAGASDLVVIAGGSSAMLGGLVLGWRFPSTRLLVMAGGFVFTALLVAAALRVESVQATPIATWAERGAAVQAVGVVTRDPQRYPGTFDDFVVTRVRLVEVASRGERYSLATPVLVMGDSSWSSAQLGARLTFAGLLEVAADDEVGAVVRARGSPEVIDLPSTWWRAADGVRRALKASVAHRPADQRALVPALVVGDDSAVTESLSAAFRATGLTHLLAVSGTNLTLLVGFLLIAARWCGVRGRGLYVVGALGIVGFILLARFEPSVIRAAAMGTVGLVGMGAEGRRRGGRALGVAIIAILLLEPWLADSPGFALSVLATAGIVYLAPAWRDALTTWLPRWTAEAIAVPAAAQLVCTPLVVVLSGQVSLVAVAANLLAAPAVGPATVLGLLGGFLGVVWSPLGELAGMLASWCAGWIVLVARRGADLPTPDVGWSGGAGWVALLVVLCVVGSVATPWVLRRWWVTGLVTALVTLMVLTRVPTPGWPPPGWVFAACDVGQGDALVVNAGRGAAVVIDAGPDPTLVDRCLRRLEITQVSLVVLTHFHADHVDGLDGVLRGRATSLIETTALHAPHDRWATVRELALEHNIETRTVPFGVTRQIGAVRLQAIWPADDPSRTSASGEPNNASVVLLVEVRGVHLLLTGDVEPPAQLRLAQALGGLEVDVLKVPHHGSRFQDFDLLTGLSPEVAVFSAGIDNDYGHPAPETLSALQDAGASLARTDTQGDVLVVLTDDSIGVRHRDFSSEE
jgi:competence protein ComEC